MAYILATKLGMTRVFTDDGRSVGVTVLEAGPCTVTHVKTDESDGYQAVQLGFGHEKHPTKPVAGHQAKAKTTHKWLREFRVAGNPTSPDGSTGASALPAVGDVLNVGTFEAGQAIKIVGVSKGKGFAGTIKRHNFKKGPGSHGSDQHRQPGSIGSGYPQRVFAGLRMAGHMGHERVSVAGATIQAIHPETNLLVVTGPVPGPTKGLVLVQTAE